MIAGTVVRSIRHGGIGEVVYTSGGTVVVDWYEGNRERCGLCDVIRVNW